MTGTYLYCCEHAALIRYIDPPLRRVLDRLPSRRAPCVSNDITAWTSTRHAPLRQPAFTLFCPICSPRGCPSVCRLAPEAAASDDAYPMRRLVRWRASQRLLSASSGFEIGLSGSRFASPSGLLCGPLLPSERVIGSLKLFTSVLLPLGGFSSYHTGRPCSCANRSATSSASP